MFSYRQTIPVEFLKTEMAFETEELTLEFLAQFGLTFTDSSRQHLDCKTSMAVLANIWRNQYGIFTVFVKLLMLIIATIKLSAQLMFSFCHCRAYFCIIIMHFPFTIIFFVWNGQFHREAEFIILRRGSIDICENNLYLNISMLKYLLLGFYIHKNTCLDHWNMFAEDLFISV